MYDDLALDPDTAAHTDIADALDNYSFADTPDNNDYCFVEWPEDTTHTSQITQVERYKYNGTNWAYEYTLNNSGMTAAQLAATLSGITDTKVTKLDNLPTNSELEAQYAKKATSATANHLAALDGNGNPTDSGISKEAVVQSTDLSHVVIITQAQYYALASVDPNIEYIII